MFLCGFVPFPYDTYFSMGRHYIFSLHVPRSPPLFIYLCIFCTADWSAFGEKLIVKKENVFFYMSSMADTDPFLLPIEKQNPLKWHRFNVKDKRNTEKTRKIKFELKSMFQIQLYILFMPSLLLLYWSYVCLCVCECVQFRM